MSFFEKYKYSVVPFLKSELKVSSLMAIPKLDKIVISIGIGSWLQGAKDYSKIVEGLSLLSGQKPMVRFAKISVSNFRLRQGMPVGLTVTLRRNNMYDFMERFVKVVSPRIRDFDGFSLKSFDGRGNYSLGLKSYSVFPEIHYKDLVKNYGVAVTFVTSSNDDNKSLLLLKAFGIPFKKQ
jgi:large subunit ribosomal protein L5